MADLKVGIVLRAVDKATAPLKALSRSTGGTQAALAKLQGQASQVRKLGALRSELGSLGSKLDVSRKKTADLGRELKRTADPSEKLRTAFERSQRQTVSLAGAHRRQRGELRNLSESLRKAGLDTRRLHAEQERLERTSGRLRRRLAGLPSERGAPRSGGFGTGFLGGLAGGAVFSAGRAAMRLPGGFVETASMFETMETTLGTIEGSSRKARKSMEWIENFAATTPFEIDQVSEAFVKLRAYGMEPTGGLLRSLGDTASAMGKDVMQAVEAIADAVTGENERLKEFGIKARTKGDTVTYEYGGGKVATANARDRAEIQRVLTGIMDEQYSGAMDDRMKTFSGMMSNMSDQWTRFQLKVMESGPFEVIKERLRGVLDSINAMAASGELQAYADRVGQWFVDAFAAFESDVWPVLKDEVWPALKDIAGVIGQVLKLANKVAEALGGWGNVIKGGAYLGIAKLALGGVRLAQGGLGSLLDFGGSIKDFGGGIKDAVTSERAGRMRKGGGRLLASAFDIGKAGVSRAGGGLTRFGRTLASLALRFAPLLAGALKALAAVFAGISLPVAAAVAAIAGAAYLIWKHWEPIKGFFSKLWVSVKAAFSGFWEWLSSVDWSGLGARLMATLAKGIRGAPGLVWDALKFGLGKLSDLLPSSDARAGPLSRLSSSGAAILATLGDGVRKVGPGALRRPLAGALGTAAAGLALSIPPVAALSIPPVATDRPLPWGRARPALQERLQAATRPALQPESPAPSPSPQPAPQVARTVHHHYRITIQQLPGEDAQALTERVLRELERVQALAGREALGDAY